MPVNIALLGAGVFARQAHLPAIQQSTSSALHTVWSRSEATARGLAESSGTSPKVEYGERGLEAVLADPLVQAVIIALPIERQPEYVRRAWAAGKHVLSEKPLGPDVDQAKEMLREYEKTYAPKGLIWRVAENFAHEPMIHKARELLANPSSGLGDILYWSMSFHDFVPDGTHKYQSTTWRTIPAYQGGFLFDGGVHYAALLRTILPTRPAAVVGITALHRTHLPPNDHFMALCMADPSSAVDPHGPPTKLTEMQHSESALVNPGKSVQQGTFTLSVAPPNTSSSPHPYGAVVTCVNGVVSLLQSSEGWTLRVDGAQGTGVKDSEVKGPSEGVEVEVEMFAKAIEQGAGEPNYGQPRDGLWDVAFIQAILDSHGKQVDLAALASV